MEINVTLNLTNNQVADLLSWIMKDGVVKNVLIGECVKHARERIEEWETSVRLSNVCRANGIVTAADLLGLTESQFLKLRGSGRKCLIEISQLMYDKGLKFKNEDAPQNTKESPENSPASPVQHAQAKMPSWEEIWKSLYHLEPPCVSDILGGKVIRYYAYAVYDYIARHIGCAQ